jgi:DNA-binding LacI/PurR family transcriptional regulator
MGGIAKVTWERQAVFAVAHVPTTVQDISGYLYSMIDDGMFDGILLRMAGDLDEELLIPFTKRNFPYVAIKRYLPHRKINCVMVDDKQGAFMATEHLIQMGHRRIGLIVTQSFAVGRDRYQGYMQALQHYGIPFDPELVIQTQNFLEESGRRAAAPLIAMNNRPTAIFAPSDVLAFGVYQAVSEAELRIPEDIAIVGYDDIPAAALVVPPLTTIRTPYFEFGARAAELLLDIITQQVIPPHQIVIDHALLVRESSAYQLPAPMNAEVTA